MSTLTIRNFSDIARSHLQALARANGRSMEAQARLILTGATAAPPMGFGDILVAAGRQYEVVDEDVEFVLAQRNRTPAVPMSFDE